MAKTILAARCGSESAGALLRPVGMRSPQHLAGPKIDHVQPAARCAGHPRVSINGKESDLVTTCGLDTATSFHCAGFWQQECQT
jgi:hypothetical protein